MTKRCKKSLWAVTIAIWWVGCDQPTASPVSSTSSPPPAIASQTVIPTEVPPTTAQPQVESPAAAPTTAPTSSPSRIRLSTAVALAQTLPDGTSVLCSIDYQWVTGEAQQGVEYVWVIELGNGQRMTGSANVMKQRGTIRAILRGVKPDQGPFKAAIFTRSSSPGLTPEQISDFVNLTN